MAYTRQNVLSLSLRWICVATMFTTDILSHFVQVGVEQ
jgi:hypothetical protein